MSPERKATKAQLRDIQRRQQSVQAETSVRPDTKPKTAIDLIKQEAAKLDFSPEDVAAERELWQQFVKPPFRIPPRFSVEPQAKKVVNTYLETMQKSRNPVFSQAVENYLWLASQDFVSLDLDTGIVDPVGVTPVFENDGESRHILIINPNHVLARVSGEGFGLQFSHEVEHLRECWEHIRSLDLSHTKAEKAKAHKQWFNDFENTVAAEARAYKVTIDALITQVGLGMPIGKIENAFYDPEIFEDAAVYIRGGMDHTSFSYVERIRRNAVSPTFAQQGRLKPLS